ncbi:hypothetical protein TNCV_3485041 [Trichonephila clavipes]|nr:hypothetical protein TNCV_3485041 [Trichonephila clavipes]
MLQPCRSSHKARHIFLFPNPKRSLKGHSFKDVPVIEQDVIQSLKELMAPKPLQIGNHIKSGVLMAKETTLNNFNDVHQSDQQILLTRLVSLPYGQTQCNY